MSLVPLADVKDYLDVGDSTSDARLQGVIDAAEAEVAQWISAGTTLASETITQRAPGGSLALTLNHSPVISVTSVTGVFSGALNLPDLDVDLEHGLIYYVPGLWMPFLDPWYTVVFQAGYANLAALPADYVYAVKELCRDNWSPQRGNRSATPDHMTGRQRAQEIVAFRQVSGFA